MRAKILAGIDPNGNVATYNYDAVGNVLSIPNYCRATCLRPYVWCSTSG